MSSNSIYFAEWNTGVGHKIRAEIYPLSTKTGTNTTLPAFESRYVQLPDDILLSVGSISSQFEMLPMGVPESGTLQVSVNLTHCPDHLRERFLGNKENYHPAVWAIFIAPDGINWERRALFVGVQKRVPSMSIKINNNSDEIIDFDIIDIFRFCFEYVKLDDSAILTSINENHLYLADRLYEYAVIETAGIGGNLHSHFSMGSKPERWVFEANNYRNSAWMCGLKDLLWEIVQEVDALYARLFCQDGDTRVRIDYELDQGTHAHQRVTHFFNHATTLANTISEDPATSDLYFIAKITDRHNTSKIVGGELYDKKDGILKLGNCYDFIKAYCENFTAKLSYWVEGFPNTMGIPMLNIKTLGAFEGVAYNHDYIDEVAKVMNVLKDGIDLEIGAASIRSCRAIIQNPVELDVTEYETTLTGAESERDFDVLLYFHNHPSNVDSDNLYEPGRTFSNPDVKSPFSDGPDTTMNSAFSFFPYSKIYLKHATSTLPWANPANIAFTFVKPAENVTIHDTMFTQNQVYTTHPAITKFVDKYWTPHITAVQAGVDSRVGLGFAVADYMTKVFGSTNNMVLSCSTTNVFLFDLGKKIRSNTTTLDLQDFGFGYETTALAYSADDNTANVITSVDFNLMSGISRIKIFVKGQ